MAGTTDGPPEAMQRRTRRQKRQGPAINGLAPSPVPAAAAAKKKTAAPKERIFERFGACLISQMAARPQRELHPQAASLPFPSEFPGTKLGRVALDATARRGWAE